MEISHPSSGYIRGGNDRDRYLDDDIKFPNNSLVFESPFLLYKFLYPIILLSKKILQFPYKGLFLYNQLIYLIYLNLFLKIPFA